MDNMYAEGSTKPLRLGIGTFGLSWIVAMTFLLAIFGFGLYAYIYQLIHGDTVTGMRTIGSGGVAWGLYIVFVVFFVGVSFSGITISAIIRLFGISYLKPIARLAELATIISLSIGACCILADLSNPLVGLLNLPRYARVMSPFFGDFTLVVSASLFASVVYLYLSGRPDAAFLLKQTKFLPLRLYYRLWSLGFKGTPDDFNRHDNASYWLSIVILPLLITAHSTLGFIFGIQASRPGWYSALQAPSFVVLAAISGTGVIIVIASIVRNRLHLEEVITEKCIKWLGLTLMILTMVYLYLMIVEQLTAHYAAPEAELEVANQLIMGVYAPYFWTTVACLVGAFGIIFYNYVRGSTIIWMHALAGILVNVAAIAKRIIIVVPSQTHGNMLPYMEGSYHPTWVEIWVVLGLTAGGILVYMALMKAFPIVPLNTKGEHHDSLLQVHLKESRPSHFRRMLLFGLTLLIGLTMAISGFLLSARVGTDANSDPIVPFSPVIFIIGLVICFVSAIIYEIVPEIKKNVASAEG